MKGQLHQLLAAEADLTGKSNRLLEEAKGTFGKAEHFIGAVRELKMFDEARSGEETVEVKVVDTTVKDKVKYLKEPITDALDAFLQKETTNQHATADVIINDETILSGVPATALLGLETKLKSIRKVYESIPTLSPGIAWEQSGQDHVFKDANPTVRMRTEKTYKPVVLHEADAKHPAQVEKISIDEAVGSYTEHRESGMISSAMKSQVLGRIDRLITAVKTARMAANCEEVQSVTCGDTIMDYINDVEGFLD